MINRFSLVLLAYLCSSMFIFGQGTETFTNLNASGSVYSTNNYVGDNGSIWNYQNARAVPSNSSYRISGISIGLNEGVTSISSITGPSGPNGVGRLSYKIRSYFTSGTAADRTVEIYLNGMLYESYTLAEMSTIVDRSLTANISGNVSIEFRSKGSRQIVIDDIAWTDYKPSPHITIDKTLISGLNYQEGFGPSASQTFILTGIELLDDITLKAPPNFEISISPNSGYRGLLIISPYRGMINQTIYVRLRNDLAFGEYSGTITASSPSAINKTIEIQGIVTLLPAEVIISEIMYDSMGADDEWIEICNISGRTQNLSSHSIAVNSTKLFTFPANSFIADGECVTVAIGDNGIAPFNEECSFVPNYGTPVVSNNLPNSSATIEILSPGGSVLDSVRYSTGNGGDGNGTSLHIVNIFQDNSTTSFNWMEVENGGSPGKNSLLSPCSYPEIQLKNSSGNLQDCGNFTLNFDREAIGYQTEQTFDIKNDGTIALVISEIKITGSEFSLVSPTLPQNIAPGYTQTVTIKFSPSALGNRTAELTIVSNDGDEINCKIQLKGVGYTPVPEIDVERNTFASIANNNSANTGNNTVFASTVIGSTTSPKTYYIRNEGTAPLSVSNVSSSNSSEFRILGNLGSFILAPGDYKMFEIDFTPNGIGTRQSVITIANNDLDENPYIINIKGTGICSSANITLLPSTGPVGTVVTVVGANFGTGTTASLNGINSSITYISTSKVEVTIPAGASTGNLIIKDNNGCINNKRFTVLDLKATACEGDNGLNPADLFISEVTDKGTGSHSYIEIYNGTGTAINLTPYKVALHNNGSTTATSLISLSGIIQNKSTIVVAMGGANRLDREGGYTAQFFSSAPGINDDDHIRLTKSGVWIDLWGDTTGDPFTIASKDYTYRRKGNGVYAPSTTWNKNDWLALNPVDYSDIGKHDFSIGIPPEVKSNPIGPSEDCEIVDTIIVDGTEGHPGGNPLSYKWFYNAPGDSGWTEISLSNTEFTGQNTASLNIVEIGEMNGYQFFSQIEENTSECYGTTNAIRMKVNKTTWDGLKWSDGAPHFGSTAILTGNYNTSVNGNFSACKLSVTDGAILTIDNQGYVEITNNLTVKSISEEKPSKILVKTSGNFIQINNDALVTVQGTAKIEVEKKTSPMDKWYQYTYWSTPVKGVKVDDALALSNPSRRFYFEAKNYLDLFSEINNNNQTLEGPDGIDDNGDDWVFAGGNVMIPGLGYASTNSKDSFTGEDTPQTFLYKFVGPFNNGIIEVPIYRNDNQLLDVNWNFIGNPYPSPISADIFLNNNPSLDGAILLWSQGTEPSYSFNGNEPMNFSQDDYAIINGAGETAGGDGIRPQRYIPSAQGFFVSYSNEGEVLAYSEGIKTGKVIFTNNMRSKGLDHNMQFFRQRDQIEPNKLWINLTSDVGVFSQTLIAYLDEASDEYDGAYYDAAKNMAVNSFASVYTMIDNENSKFVIQGKSSENLVLNSTIPLGFSLALQTNDIYKISLEDFQGDFLEENSIMIRDLYLNIDHNLKQSEYRFTSEKGDFKDRFEIFYSTEDSTLDLTKKSFIDLKIVELSTGELQFSNTIQAINAIEISDLTGRVIYNLVAKNLKETFFLPQLTQSAYIAKISFADGTTVTKKLIKRI